MKYAVTAIVIAAAITGSSHAVAQSAPSTDIIMQRLDAMDKRNAKLESENAALRDRVRLLEVGKRSAATTPAPSPTASAASPTSAMAMVPKSSASGAYKAPIAYPPLAYNWTGFYVGAHLGGGLARSQWTEIQPLFCMFSDPCPPTFAGSHNAPGLLGGGQVGYNRQFGNWVLGVDAQYSFADLAGDHQNNTILAASQTIAPGYAATFSSVERLSTKVDGIATFAGRIGFASEALDRTLFYVKGGGAYARTEYAERMDLSLTQCFTVANVSNCSIQGLGGPANVSQNRWGWMTGIGLEYGLTDNWSASIDYSYLGFGTNRVDLQAALCDNSGNCLQGARSIRSFDINQNIQMLKFGVNYRFNLAGGKY